MAVPKKKVPFALLEILKPEDLRSIHPVDDKETVMSLYDNELGSGFYFKIWSENANSNKFLVEINPPSKNSTSPLKVNESISSVVEILNSWIELIDSYSEIDTIYDDQILKSYQAEFEKKLDIIDEDADIVPFNLEQQIYIDTYLEHVKKQMRLLSEGKKEDEKKEFSEIENDAIQLQKELTKESKRKIVQKLSKILAKAQCHILSF